jgi:hypothetical protein
MVDAVLLLRYDTSNGLVAYSAIIPPPLYTGLRIWYYKRPHIQNAFID